MCSMEVKYTEFDEKLDGVGELEAKTIGEEERSTENEPIIICGK